MSSSRSAIDQVRESLVALRAADLDVVPVRELGAEVLELTRLMATLEAVTAARLAAFDARGGHELDCAATAAAWLRRALHLDSGDARHRVNSARLLRDHPDTADALADGEITSAHVRTLVRAAKRLGPDVLAESEPILLPLAKAAPPAQVGHAVDRIAQATDADDDRDARALRQHADRYLLLSPGLDGGRNVTGYLDEAAALKVEAMFTAYAQPHPLPDESPDPRSLGQRQADALTELAELALTRPDVPTVGRQPVTVTLTTDRETLRNEAPTWAPTSAVAAVFRHAFGQAALDRLTCCADITPAIVTAWGEPLALGRTARYANATLMKALWLRDGGCVNPGCTNQRVHAHHIVEWQHGGDTNLANMALVCSRDHTLLHEHGWRLEPDPHRPGLLHWRPPDGRPPHPATHTIDRNPGTTTPLS